MRHSLNKLTMPLVCGLLIAGLTWTTGCENKNTGPIKPEGTITDTPEAETAEPAEPGETAEPAPETDEAPPAPATEEAAPADTDADDLRTGTPPEPELPE